MGSSARHPVDGLGVLPEEAALRPFRSDASHRGSGDIPPEVEKSSQQTLQDMPISFDSEHRKYTLRTVEETYINLENPQYVEVKPQAHSSLVHDPMEVL